MKWVEISKKKNEKRFLKLAEFLNQQQFKNEVSFIECQETGFFEAIKEAQSQFDQIRISNDFGVQALNFQRKNPSEIESIGAADAYYQQNGQWWMRCFQAQAFKGLLSRIGSTLDLNHPVLIVGTGALARIAFSMLTKIGFKKISFTSTSTEEGLGLITHLEKKYFDVDVEFLFMNDLVMLSGQHTILLNTMVVNEENQKFFEEIYYLNFLHTGALVWDFSTDENNTKLIEEAELAEYFTMSGHELFVRSDLEWVYALTGKRYQIEEYVK